MAPPPPSQPPKVVKGLLETSRTYVKIWKDIFVHKLAKAKGKWREGKGKWKAEKKERKKRKKWREVFRSGWKPTRVGGRIEEERESGGEDEAVMEEEIVAAKG